VFRGASLGNNVTFYLLEGNKFKNKPACPCIINFVLVSEILRFLYSSVRFGTVIAFYILMQLQFLKCSSTK
jgi:hypothetical protein